MRCSSCGKGALRHGKFEEGLPCYLCSACGGGLMSLSPYVDWMIARRKEPAEPTAEPFDEDVADTRRAIACPKCSRIMVKHRVSADSAHGLDYCFSCEEVWLDRGEWAWLKARGLHLHITSVTTEAWQRRLRDQRQQEAYRERFRGILGEEVFAETERIRCWLAAQPRRDDILHYLEQDQNG